MLLFNFTLLVNHNHLDNNTLSNSLTIWRYQSKHYLVLSCLIWRLERYNDVSFLSWLQVFWDSNLGVNFYITIIHCFNYNWFRPFVRALILNSNSLNNHLIWSCKHLFFLSYGNRHLWKLGFVSKFFLVIGSSLWSSCLLDELLNCGPKFLSKVPHHWSKATTSSPVTSSTLTKASTSLITSASSPWATPSLSLILLPPRILIPILIPVPLLMLLT